MREITRIYESMVVINPDLTEAEAEEFIEKLKSLVAKYGGKMLGVNKWGKRKLAYEIKRHEYAYYWLLYFEGDSETVAKLESNYNILEPILRYMTVLIEAMPTDLSEGEVEKQEVLNEENQQSEEGVSRCLV